MSNEERYNFKDFTEDSYRKYLMTAKRKYIFRDYHNFDKSENFILWRHDIDFSVHRAKKLAEIENEEKVKATYFIHLHSEFYNVFEVEISKLIHEIIELGHTIGLHFDTHYYSVNDENLLEEHIEFEKKVLNRLFNTDIKTFSFHNNNSFTLSCKKWSYAGLINTYADYFQTEVSYCSDSNGYWKYKRLEDVLNENNKNLHVLTHPEWWQKDIKSPYERIKRCIKERANNNERKYLEFLEFHKAKNIDWE